MSWSPTTTSIAIASHISQRAGRSSGSPRLVIAAHAMITNPISWSTMLLQMP
jgi:hypothetical protein